MSVPVPPFKQIVASATSGYTYIYGLTENGAVYLFRPEYKKPGYWLLLDGEVRKQSEENSK